MRKDFFHKVKFEFHSKRECVEISKKWEAQEKVLYAEETASSEIQIISGIQWILHSSWQNQAHDFLSSFIYNCTQ